MCLVLIACSKEDSGNNSDKNNAKDSDYTAAAESNVSAIETKDNTAEPETDSIEVTVDNWQDYFELGYELDVDYEDDGVTIDDYKLHLSIYVKDGYDVTSEEDKVDLIFDVKYEWRFVLLNKNNLTYEIGGICDGHDPYPDEVYDISISPGTTYRWLTSTISYGAGWIKNTGNIAFEDLFCLHVEDTENGERKAMVLIQQSPVLTCTEASGKVILK